MKYKIIMNSKFKKIIKIMKKNKINLNNKKKKMKSQLQIKL